MGERKVLNKYIPSDFDPRLVPKGTKPKDDLVPVRMMLPFSIQCENCSSFLYRGRKFNSKKEPVRGSEGKYLGIQRYRFYIKCSVCSRPLTFLTDPKNADYEMESGGTRNYEVHKDKEKTQDEIMAEEALKEKEDPMKALENRVLASAKEMADLDNLDEIKAMNMRNLKMMSGIQSRSGAFDSTAVVLASREGEKGDDSKVELVLDEEDEAMIKSIQFGKKKLLSTHQSSILRLDEAAEEELERTRQKEQEILEKQQLEMSAKVQLQKRTAHGMNPLVKVKRRRKEACVSAESKTGPLIKKNNVDEKKRENGHVGDSLVGLLGAYGSDSE